MSGNKALFVRFVQTSLESLVHSFLLCPDKEVMHGTFKFSIILMGKMTIICAVFQQ